MGLGICGWATSRRVGAWFYSAGMTEARGPLTGPAWSARPTALTGRPGRATVPGGSSRTRSRPETSSRHRLRNDAGMTRRPNEPAAQWFERAIVTNSVAAAQQETLPEGSNANPAAREAIDQRAREAAADLELAAAAFRAERYQAKPEG